MMLLELTAPTASGHDDAGRSKWTPNAIALTNAMRLAAKLREWAPSVLHLTEVLSDLFVTKPGANDPTIRELNSVVKDFGAGIFVSTAFLAVGYRLFFAIFFSNCVFYAPFVLFLSVLSCLCVLKNSASMTRSCEKYALVHGANLRFRFQVNQLVGPAGEHGPLTHGILSGNLKWIQVVLGTLFFHLM